MPAYVFRVNVQSQIPPQKGEYRALATGFHLSSRGMGGDIRFLRGTAGRTLEFGLRAYGLKAARETKIESQFQERGTRYIYGKLNRLMVVTPYAGIQHTLIPRRKGSFLSVKNSLQIGPALGLLRPYYLDIFVPSPIYQQMGTPEPQPFDPAEHSYVDIVGVSSIFVSGFGRVSLRPGLSLRASSLVDFAQRDSYIQGIELGANLDIFFSEVQLMADVHNPSVFLAFSLGMVMGNGWRVDEEMRE